MKKTNDGIIRLHEGELNVMELLWSNKELAAKDIAKIIKEYIGWEKNTTYTVIKVPLFVKIPDLSVKHLLVKRLHRKLRHRHF